MSEKAAPSSQTSGTTGEAAASLAAAKDAAASAWIALLVEAIRQASKERKLTALSGLNSRFPLPEDLAEIFPDGPASALEKAAEARDLCMLSGSSETWYFSNLTMTETYATYLMRLEEKDILRIEGPYGSFYLREDSPKPMILLASGTGFAPIKAIIEHMQFKGITRPTTLYWGGRRPTDLYQSAWIEAQLASMPHLHYVPVVSDALPEDQWTGRTGFVHQAVLQDFPDLSGHQVYACGAPIVVESARTDFSARAGLPPEEFFADAFTSAVDKV